jgi:hypothetical protein
LHQGNNITLPAAAPAIENLFPYIDGEPIGATALGTRAAALDLASELDSTAANFVLDGD